MNEIPLSRHNIAYAFKSNHSLEQMQARLNAKGPWHWQMRDSHYCGYYLRTHESSDLDFRRLRVFSETDRFVLDVLFESDDPNGHRVWHALTAAVRSDLLPALDARDVQPAEPYD